MKALMGTAAVVVIATCGYFIYENQQEKAEKAAIEQELAKQEEYLRCRKSLLEVKNTLETLNLWEGRTHSQRLEEISNSKHPFIVEYGGLLSLALEVNWEKCGPL